MSRNSKQEYMQAMSQQLTPERWSAIVARAIHDATFGKSADRTKAREWLGRYVLLQKMEADTSVQAYEMERIREEIERRKSEIANREPDDVELSGIVKTEDLPLAPFQEKW
jgi:hypothetical protein